MKKKCVVSFISNGVTTISFFYKTICYFIHNFKKFPITLWPHVNLWKDISSWFISISIKKVSINCNCSKFDFVHFYFSFVFLLRVCML